VKALDIHALLRAAAPDDVPVVEAVVPMGSDGIDVDATGLLVSLTYLTLESYVARVSADASALAALSGFALIRSELSAAGETLRLVLWYGPQVAIAPPAPVSAKKK
jgi:hypothetical protein